MSDAPFRLLSLDGGGVRGLYSAAFLEHIEQHSGKRLIDYFDLIVGTSTGAIIALGLASGMSAAEVLHFYQEQGRHIFADGRGWFGQLFRPKYDNRRLTDALKGIFGDQIMNDLQVPVCVASYELVQGTPRVFKNDHHRELHWGGRQPIWKVAAASSAAPLVFPAFQVESQDSHIDGGIWANNPIMVGLAEAVRYFDRQLDDVLALSVGTGTKAFRLERSRSVALGWIGWGRDKRIVNVVFDAQSQSAHESAKLMLPREQYIRIDANLSSPISLDDFSAALPLIERGAQAGRRYKNEVEQRFLTHPRVPSSSMPEAL